MGLLRKDYSKGLEKCWYLSSNILYSEFNDEEFTLYVVYKGGKCYLYKDVNVNEYLLFREDPSQGKALNKFIKKYEFNKLENIDANEITEEINRLKQMIC